MVSKKEKIKRSAKELFASQGFKNTKVKQIMNTADMAAGTFYNYFSSKDSLFMEIFLEENVKLKRRITKNLNIDGDPMKVMKKMMFMNQKGMMKNPILSEWYNKDIFEKIERKYRKEHGIEKMEFLYQDFLKIVKKWQQSGKIRQDMNVKMIMAIFTALINIDAHKDEIG